MAGRFSVLVVWNMDRPTRGDAENAAVAAHVPRTRLHGPQRRGVLATLDNGDYRRFGRRSPGDGAAGEPPRSARIRVGQARRKAEGTPSAVPTRSVAKTASPGAPTATSATTTPSAETGA
jgi:hypothetical protein